MISWYESFHRHGVGRRHGGRLQQTKKRISMHRHTRRCLHQCRPEFLQQIVQRPVLVIEASKQHTIDAINAYRKVDHRRGHFGTLRRIDIRRQNRTQLSRQLV